MRRHALENHPICAGSRGSLDPRPYPVRPFWGRRRASRARKPTTSKRFGPNAHDDSGAIRALSPDWTGFTQSNTRKPLSNGEAGRGSGAKAAGMTCMHLRKNPPPRRPEHPGHRHAASTAWNAQCPLTRTPPCDDELAQVALERADRDSRRLAAPRRETKEHEPRCLDTPCKYDDGHDCS